MTQDIDSLDLVGTESPQSIDYNEEGTYTVSFTEPDLMSYAAATSIGPEVAVEDDEMSRDGDSSNMATDQELIVEDEPAPLTVEEAPIVEDEIALEPSDNSTAQLTIEEEEIS